MTEQQHLDQLAFQASSAMVGNDISVISSNLEAPGIRVNGYRIQLQSTRNQMDLLAEELESKSTPGERVLSRRSEALGLRRAMFEADSQIGRLEAEIAQLTEMRATFEAQCPDTIANHRKRAGKRVRTTAPVAEYSGPHRRDPAPRAIYELLQTSHTHLERYHFSLFLKRPLHDTVPAPG
ncbi:MAG: hypothetical protein ACNA7Q_14330 [Rhodobacterales bacterium]